MSSPPPPAWSRAFRWQLAETAHRLRETHQLLSEADAQQGAASCDDEAALLADLLAESKRLVAAIEAKTNTQPTCLALNDDDVRRAMPMVDAIQIQERAFAEAQAGRATVPARHIISTGDGGATLFKPAHVPRLEALGMKLVSVRPGNSKLGLPTVPAVVLLADEATGLPSALISATWLTALRTAAGSGAAAKRLARPDAKVLVVFGAGMQAAAHVAAMRVARPTLTRIVIVNRTAPRAERLAATLSVAEWSSGIETAVLSDTDGIRAAVGAADIICTCTNTSTPLFGGESLRPGTFIAGVGSYTPTMIELDLTTVSRCLVVVDTAHALEAGELVAAKQAGRLRIAESLLAAEEDDASTCCDAAQEAGERERTGVVAGDLAALVTGQLDDAVAGARHHAVEADNAPDCLFYKSVGTALQDVATAAAVLSRAKIKGVGQHLSMA